MNFDAWEPAYEAILTDFGFDRRADELARDLLASLLQPTDIDLSVLRNRTVAILGGAPTLRDELQLAKTADVLIATASAATLCRKNGIPIDMIVTDLDTEPDTVREFTGSGVPVIVHAHGDNMELIQEHLPEFRQESVLGTTQASPRSPVLNVGGFTDGDRGAFLADHYGADQLRFPGWDFDDQSVTEQKQLKLAWAERLIHWLEHRRGEQFSVLDGRRGDISLGQWAL